MLSIGTIADPGSLESYFGAGAVLTPYMAGEHPELVGTGKALFGLSDVFTRQQFEGLVSNRIRKTAKDGRKSRIAMDLTFSAPKSVSLLFEFGTEEQKADALEAHHHAMTETLKYIESSGMFISKSEKGRKNLDATGMVAAIFMHDYARESKTQLPEPDLHGHCLIANVCMVNGQERHVNYWDILKNKKQLGSIYRTMLQQKLNNMGYDTRLKSKKENYWELSSVTDAQVEHFSSRRKDILAEMPYVEEELQKAGVDLTFAEKAQMANLRTRKGKKTLDKDLHKQILEKRKKAVGLSLEKKRSVQVKKENFDLYLNNAINECEKMLGLFTLQDLMIEFQKQAREHNIAVSKKDFERELAKTKSLAKIENEERDKFAIGRYTTENLLVLTKKVEDAQREGEGIYTDPLIKNEDVKKGIERFNLENEMDKGWRLKAEQERMIEHVLGSKDLVCAVQGRAGTGKTTAAQVIRQILGPKVHGLALQAVAAKNLQDEAGIESGTIDGFVMAVKNGNRALIDKISGGLLLVDEAGMVGTHHMSDLIDIAKQCDARIVLVGDTDQLKPVTAGDPFIELQNLGMKTVELKDITRQKDEMLLDAVKQVVTTRNVQKSIEILDERGSIKEVNDEKKRLNNIVKEAIEDTKQGKSPLVITSTNADRLKLNAGIRDALQKKKIIPKDGVDFALTNKDGEKAERNFVVGEKVVFLENNKMLGVQNGNVGIIQEIEGKKIVISVDGNNKIVVDTDKYGALDYGYAVTTYKSQGRTVDKCIYHAKSGSKLLSANEFYVGISREKFDLSIYTDDKEKLISKASKWHKKHNALDVYNNGLRKVAVGKDRKEIPPPDESVHLEEYQLPRWTGPVLPELAPDAPEIPTPSTPPAPRTPPPPTALDRVAAERELNAMCRIDLIVYAMTCGYRMDKKESTNTSIKLRNEGDVIIVRKRKDGVFEYFSGVDDRDNGTIIQFVQNRKRCSLGEVRKELRQYLSISDRVDTKKVEKESETEIDYSLVQKRYDDCKQKEVKYLTERGIRPEIQKWSGAREDYAGNAVFAHTDGHGHITGYEIKGPEISIFSKGGTKGVAAYGNRKEPRRIVVCESSIDALSKAQLEGAPPDTLYLSTGGAWGKGSRLVLAEALRRWPAAALVAAFDRDDRGGEYLAELRRAAAGRQVIEDRPPEGIKDWNDVLRIVLERRAKEISKSDPGQDQAPEKKAPEKIQITKNRGGRGGMGM